MSVSPGKKLRNPGVKTLAAASERARKKGMSMWLPYDPGASGSQFNQGQELNVQVQEEQKGDFGGRLFHRVKKQAHYPTFPCGPQAAGLAP